MRDWVEVERKYSVGWLVWLLAVTAALALTPVGHAQSNIGQVKAAAINTFYYPGVSPYTASIQSAATAACASVAYAHSGVVVVMPGFTLSDVPTGVTGCAGVTIEDRSHGLPVACYASTGGLYTAHACVSGSGGATDLSGVAAGLAPTSSGLYDFNNNAIATTSSVTANEVITTGMQLLSGTIGNCVQIGTGHSVTTTGSPCGTGSGVSSVSSGNLSPLFTVAVANPTTTPAFTFTQSTAAANSVYGNFTGSAAAPTFSATPAFAVTNLTGTGGFAITGNAGSATKLATARTINGTSFDGTANITITAAPTVAGLEAVLAASPYSITTACSSAFHNAALVTASYATSGVVNCDSQWAIDFANILNAYTTGGALTVSINPATGEVISTGTIDGVGLDAGSAKVTRIANGTAGTDAAAFGQIPVQFTSTVSGIVPGSGGGTTNFLRADGAWAAPGGGAMIWPATPGIANCTGTPCTAWATSLTPPAGAIVGTSDAQMLTNKAISFDQITSGTNTTHGLVIGTGSVLTTAGTGINNANEINGTLMSGLATGLLKNTTSTGVPSIATAGTDYVVPSGSITGNAATATNISTNGTANQVWGMNAGATAQGWQTVSGGGTPAYPLTITGGVSGGVVYANSTTQLTVSAAGTAGNIMVWGGAGAAPGTATGTQIITQSGILSAANTWSSTQLFAAIRATSLTTISTTAPVNFSVFSGTNFANAGAIFQFTGGFTNGTLSASQQEIDVTGTWGTTGTVTGNISGLMLNNTFGVGSTSVYNGTQPLCQLCLTPTYNFANSSTIGYALLYANPTITLASTAATNYDILMPNFSVTAAGLANVASLTVTGLTGSKLPVCQTSGVTYAGTNTAGVLACP